MRRSINLIFVITGLFAMLCPSWARADLIQQGATYNRDIIVTDASGNNVTGLGSNAFTVKISTNGGAQTTVTPTITEKGLGHYNVAYTTAMTGTLGSLSVVITASGAVQTDVADQIVAFNPNDSSLGVLTSTVDSGGGTTLTVRQALFLSFVASVGKFGTATRSASAPYTITVPFLRLDGTTTGWTYVTTYSDSTFTKALSRTFTVGTLP